MVCLLKTEVVIESEARFLGLKRIGKFILNEPFIIRFRFQNISEHGEIYPGGSIHILIDWHGGAPEYMDLTVDKLDAQQSTCFIETKNLRVHNTGMGTLSCYATKPEVYLQVHERRVEPGSQTRSVIDGIPATNWSEVYTFCALMVNTTVLVLSLLRDFGIMRWFYLLIARMLDP